MRRSDLFRLALGNLRENLFRTVLCLLSVAVGTGALLIITAAGLSGRTQIETGLQTLGVSGLTVSLDHCGGGTPLSAETAERMAQDISGITNSMPVKAKNGGVRAGHQEADVVLLGADDQLGAVMQLEVLYGSLPGKSQIDTAQPVAVIGDDLARQLYGRCNMVGRQIQIHFDGQSRYFTVCGVIRAQTGVLGNAFSAFAPHLVYVPYACLATRLEQADQVFVQCTAETGLSFVSGQITQYLTKRVKVDGTVHVRNMSGMVHTVRRLTDLCTMLFSAAGGVTFCVALIGVLCSMLSATHEKTGEIGILLALGAQPRDIRRLFLLQSVLLCTAGGLCGTGIAGLLLYGCGASLLLPGWRLTAAILSGCLICGAVAGLLPAVRAAGLNPIDTIHK